MDRNIELLKKCNPSTNKYRDNVNKTIQRIESRIDLINRKTDLYDPTFPHQDNDGCSLKSSHIIGEFMPMKKRHYFLYGIKSQCASINERLSKLEACINSIRKNKLKTFTPLGNECLHPSKNITQKNDHISYPMKQKDLCDYNPRCIMPRGLTFDEIIMGIISKNEFPHTTE